MKIIKRLITVLPALVVVIFVASIETIMNQIRWRPYPIEWLSGHAEWIMGILLDWSE